MKTFYFHTENGKIKVDSIKPNDFELLPFHKAIKSTTEKTAALIYNSDLRIMELRSNKTVKIEKSPVIVVDDPIKQDTLKEFQVNPNGFEAIKLFNSMREL